ncbi:MAG: TonB-dependent receptor [Sedimenticola thiotaurini]|uniref:TonB-dependent receptor n=1 Tax=Sedimenticola thiotaurini TaxID=1543721 RepID=A0A558D0G7_9GAMM|nr:MAG: TonB-dependent receptor [Sedimenticola thiotaurini]
MMRKKRKTLQLYQTVLLSLGPTYYSVGIAETETNHQIMVTASRVEQAVVDVNASVQVITADQLKAYSGRSLSEVLQFATGTIVRDLGSSSSISIRGFENGHTLLLVNGLRRTEKYAGSNVNNIALENVERIEIVRGPMSSLYGSEALGGVINIITRKPLDGNRTTLKATLGQAEGGERKTYIVHGSTEWNNDQFGNRIGVEVKRRKPFHEDTTSPVTDLLEEKRIFLTYEGTIRLNDVDELSLTAEYLEQNDSGIGQSTSFYDRIEEEERYFLALKYSGMVKEGLLDLHASLGSSDARVNRGTTLDETTKFDQQQIEADYAFEPLSGHMINTGIGYRLDDVEISTMSRKVERKVYDIFAQDQWDITDTVNLTLGARYDSYSDFGSTFNPRFMLSWRPDAWTFRLGYGTGFKAPTLLNLYMSDMIRGPYVIRGNPNLQSEESKTYEAGIAYSFNKGRVELSLHDSEIDNLISAELTGNNIGWRSESLYQNVNKAEIKGAEVVATLKIDSKSNTRISVEYLDARDMTTNDRLTDRPRWKASASINRQFGPMRIEGRVRYMRDFWATYDRLVPNHNSDYTIMDVNMDYKVTKFISLFGGIDNLFNAEIPANMAWRGTPDDPGARYYYAGVKATF